MHNNVYLLEASINYVNKIGEGGVWKSLTIHDNGEGEFKSLLIDVNNVIFCDNKSKF